MMCSEYPLLLDEEGGPGWPVLLQEPCAEPCATTLPIDVSHFEALLKADKHVFIRLGNHICFGHGQS